ncbi:epidermal growth factor receptor substrate 15-like 1 isoform X1 [Osmerus mordax]|uniref:epidermal growth factor receptor substrate 15-like 1 isoform X1 n=1 Tax=Osmerus mordax TaxID=8014 RepID=UPI00350F6301
MAALMTLSQLSSGNSAYENYYRQVDPGNTGKIRAADAAQFLKKSGLSDSTLGKIWDLADPERKGFLDKRGFFIALRLVASAQGGNDISLNNLNQTLAAPTFRDANSPLLSTPLSTSLSTSLSISPSVDSQWAVRPEEKGKFDGIFDSLSPVNGLLSGDKVKPVLINSKLPLDVLGRIWDLSDVDKDGQLDRDEFSVAMHLVYRAMENEPTPTALPASLIPPSKRKKSAGALPGAVAVLPVLTGLMSSPPLKETLRSTPSLGSVAPIHTSLSPKHSFKAASQPTVNWVVPVADRGRYDDIFLKTDSDMDGLVTGTEVIEIFMQSSLPQTTLAQIWGLADTQQVGKLSREQFSLAMYLIQQKVTKGLDPPQTITPDMIPPSERSAASAAGPSFAGFMTAVGADVAAYANIRRDSSSSTGSGDLTGVKELDELSQEIAQLQREKYSLEQEIRDKEDAIRQKNNEVQEMQDDLDRESSSLQDLESQKQDAQERLEEMDQQRSKLEGMLNDVQQKCQDESHMISSLQTQIQSQETDLQSQEAELSRTQSDLSRLQQEEGQLEQSLLAGRVQLDSIVKSLKATQDEINQARSKLSQIQDSQQEVSKSIEQYNSAINGTNGGSMTNLADMSEGFTEKENGGFGTMEDPFKSKVAMFNSKPREPQPDPFQTEDPFKSDPFRDPFGGDPFKETDPFKGSSSEDFFKKADPFASSDPFKKKPIPPAKPGAFGSSDHFPSNSPSPKPKDSDGFGSGDVFGGGPYGAKGGFADFSQMSKKPDNPMLPPKKNVPNRPAPPYGKRSHANLLGLAALDNPREPVHCAQRSQSHMASGDSTSSKESFAFGAAMKDTSGGFADVGSFGNESDQLEWAKRESEREEQERLRRLRLQEQQDLDLAIALSKADMPSV